MKTVMTPKEVFAAVQRQNQMKRDFLGHSGQMRLQDDGRTLLLENGNHSLSVEMNDIASGQLVRA